MTAAIAWSPTAASGAAAPWCWPAARTASAKVPALAAALPASVRSLTPKEYSNPRQLDDGGVLIVGASATGVQLADEIQRTGRAVTLAVGEHIRMPRVYRGRDIQWWLYVAGILDQRFDAVDDLVRARRVPSPQLVGTPRARDAGSECARATRREHRRPPGRHARRQGAVLRLAAQ